MASVKEELSNVIADAVAAASPRAGVQPRQLSEEEHALFARTGQHREVAPGEVIFRRGELGRSMFVVESGQIQLEFGDGLPDKLIGPREFFGELVLFVGSHTRVANAVAVTPTGLHIVEHDAFESLLDTEPRLIAQFMRRSFSYLVASEQQLIQGLKRRNEDLMVTLDSLRQARTQLTTAERLVQTDELTGLCNRRGLYMYLERLHQQRLPETVLGLLLVDLDHFKQINDRCGHLIGDQVLRAIAEEVQSAASSTDVPCRLGGDEFALLMQITGEEELRARATQIIAAVHALRFPGVGEGLVVSVSIGASLCADGIDWAVWYSDADAALYEAKGRGGDGYEVNHSGGLADGMLPQLA
ncbi:GGDEF domain-containing protein [Dokdonella sp.]|uniref:GGDEF domain-containing protein n=1 Tax=Dokdonella sp. TaxID=2291710 RepID=UPI001B11C8EE|nr:GGDEF domain-containing protein [Dokdonella sp.]MBO9661648.1 GGDEF domain-containing protein [Dokdonella sp.]